MTISNVIDFLRESIREISDDSVFTDQYLYETLMIARSELIQQIINDNKSISPYMYQRICVKLCPSNFIECSCTPFDFGCQVYRSVNPIPEIFHGDAGLIMNVSELYSGDHINYINERSFRYSKYRKHKNPYYSYIGQYNDDYYMFILGDKIPPKYIKMESVFNDPLMVTNFSCDEGCPKPQGIGFPLTKNKLGGLIKMALEHLNITMKVPEDRSNNAQSVPNQKIT